MAGHLGVERVTIQNLKVVSVDADRGLILVKGAVPGHDEGWVLVRDAIKKKLPDGVPFPAAIRAVAAAAPAETPAADTAAPEAGAEPTE